jgi:hypothetical protein
MGAANYAHHIDMLQCSICLYYFFISHEAMKIGYMDSHGKASICEIDLEGPALPPCNLVVLTKCPRSSYIHGVTADNGVDLVAGFDAVCGRDDVARVDERSTAELLESAITLVMVTGRDTRVSSTGPHRSCEAPIDTVYTLCLPKYP